MAELSRTGRRSRMPDSLHGLLLRDRSCATLSYRAGDNRGIPPDCALSVMPRRLPSRLPGSWAQLFVHVKYAF